MHKPELCFGVINETPASQSLAMNPTSQHGDFSLTGVVADACRHIIGFDIGGTKCAVSRIHDGALVEITRIPTGDFEATFDLLVEAARRFVTSTTTFGISCGGPLDARRGVIVSPPIYRPAGTAWRSARN